MPKLLTTLLSACCWFALTFYCFVRPTSPEGVESEQSENDDRYDEETRLVRQLLRNLI